MTSLFGPPPCPHPHVPLLCRMWDMCWWDGVYRGAVVATLGVSTCPGGVTLNAR